MSVKIIVTLGPQLREEKDILKLKKREVDFVRINMSHSSLEDLRYFIGIAQKVGIPFIVDTEGSQVRSGLLHNAPVFFSENDVVELRGEEYPESIGDKSKIFLRPKEIISQLEEGDILYMDFDRLVLRIMDTSPRTAGKIIAKAISGGVLGNNKGVAIDPVLNKRYNLPVLSSKDYGAIKIGLDKNVKHIAASFMRSGDFVEEVRRATEGKMGIISKIECQDGLDNLDDIIAKSDFLLIDRGDLSKEVPLEEIPILQKEIISRAQIKGKGVFVATNLLETMVEKYKPTRAEVCDVMHNVWGGAYGLTLAAETAIGRHPIECVNMLKTLINRAESKDGDSLIAPHGGKLVDGVTKKEPEAKYLSSLKILEIGDDTAMDVEQLATGAFSPLEGFMGQKDFQSVLDNMRLANGLVWTLPIILDVPKEKANEFNVGEDISLVYNRDILAILRLDEKFLYDKKDMSSKVYGTLDEKHPGARRVLAMNPILLAGKITLLRRRTTENSAYALTPKQVRRVFKERHWSKVVGFHTRNVIHRSHEYIQLAAMEQEGCDSLFVHPVIGKKKHGDYEASYIIKSYERMISGLYPENRVVFSTFNTYSRYAGPREAVFTAICRQNFGCSHFVVGRDHTGVGNFYTPTASHDIFDRFPDLGIKIIKFDEVFYSEKLREHLHSADNPNHDGADKLRISGTEARKMLEKGITPPEWFMRPEISEIIIDALKKGKKVFLE